MVFVTIGSTKADKIIREIDEVAPLFGHITIVQIGSGRYKPRNCEYFRFAPSLKPYYEAATVVIGHGGAGTVFELLKMKLPFIGINNPELRDFHQLELLNYLSDRRYILLCKNIKDLPNLVRCSESFKFREYCVPTFSMPNIIDNFLTVGNTEFFKKRI